MRASASSRLRSSRTARKSSSAGDPAPALTALTSTGRAVALTSLCTAAGFGCYDLDTFRHLVFQSSFLERFDVAPDLAERLKSDDFELLRFAFLWLRFALFGELTMKVKEEKRP